MYTIRYRHDRGYVAIGGTPGVVFVTRGAALVVPKTVVVRTKCHLCEMHHEGRPCTFYCETCYGNGCGKQEHSTNEHDKWVEAQEKLMRVSRTYSVTVHAATSGAASSVGSGSASGIFLDAT